MAIIDGLHGLTIYNYHIRRDTLELVCPGSVITITDPAEVETIEAWIRDIKRWLPDDSSRKSRICSYIEYMLDSGQYMDQEV